MDPLPIVVDVGVNSRCSFTDLSTYITSRSDQVVRRVNCILTYKGPTRISRTTRFTTWYTCTHYGVNHISSPESSTSRIFKNGYFSILQVVRELSIRTSCFNS